MEDSPLFNAGKGAVFTNAGTNELDASIMDGKTLKAGAVSTLKHIKNPISLARLVMERSPHVMMVGKGAEEFARQQGMGLVPQKYFYTERRWKEWQRVKEEEKVSTRTSRARMISKLALLWVCVVVIPASSTAQERLILIGGGSRPSEALARFVGWAGNERARILVIAWATSEPQAGFDALAMDFCSLPPGSC